MTKQEVTTLINVIAKVKSIAENRYNGKVYDNILGIFNNLSTSEKRTLLKGLINICFIVEDKILVSIDDLKDVKKAVNATKETINEVYTIEQLNKDQLKLQIIKLKILVTRAIILSLITVIMGFVIFLFYVDPSNGFIELLTKILSFF